MSSDIYLGAYWGARKESLSECTGRAMQCLSEIALVDDVFACWYEKRNSRRDSLVRSVDIRAREQIYKLLEQGRNRRDTDQSIIEDLGFSIDLWNGARVEKALSFSASCGTYCSNPNLRNAVVLDFPEDLGELAKRERAISALCAVVTAWEPEWAGIISRASRQARSYVPGQPFVDWMIYLPRTDIFEAQLPRAASLSRIDDLGCIISTQAGPIDTNDPAQLQNIRVVERAINMA